MSSDLKSIRLSTTGSVGIAPVRLRGVYYMTSTTKGAVSISDGNTALLVFDTITSTAQDVILPQSGIRFNSDCSVTAPAGTVLTLIYD